GRRSAQAAGRSGEREENTERDGAARRRAKTGTRSESGHPTVLRYALALSMTRFGVLTNASGHWHARAGCVVPACASREPRIERKRRSISGIRELACSVHETRARCVDAALAPSFTRPLVAPGVCCRPGSGLLRRNLQSPRRAGSDAQ